MAEEEISTPATESDVTTSEETPEVSETVESEVTEENEAAETETEAEQPEEETPAELYAGKYKTVDELVKGYQEAQKTLTQNSQKLAEYNELLKKQEQQEALRLERAKEQGYNTVNDQQIAQRVAQAELNEFLNALRTVDPDSQLQVQQYLNDYYQTGDIRYLNEAKRYYPSDFLENVAVGKLKMEERLKAQYEAEIRQKADKATQELAQTLKTDYADFLADTNENTGKAKALKSFCDANFIQSKDDMEVFKGIYKEIADFERAAAIKEYEAQKAIDAEKAKAVIETGSGAAGINSDKVPTFDEITAMSRDEYAKAVDKWGLDALMAAQ